MAHFLSWNEWQSLVESNARKRARRSAKNKIGPRLPGSYAACPSTDPEAMDQAEKSGEVGGLDESKKTIKTPNYSFDQWLKKVEKLGKEVKDTIEKGKSKEESLDKKKKDLESLDKKKKDLESLSLDKNKKESKEKKQEDTDKKEKENKVKSKKEEQK
jgi:myosin heavy subunit